jgi:exopolyphosphatase/guanosine-5'-triphosphate,3'-diphosphate pyrophosphatase
VGRAKACNSDAPHAALLLPAASFIRHLCEQTGLDVCQVPQLTLRDGLLADLMPGAHGPHSLDASHLIAEAVQLLKRYNGNLEYAKNTASLATQIFDQTAELHHLGDRVRALLEFSALVHDIGSFINVRNRHKHSMYIIQAADIAGLSRAERTMVAHIARYHRRSPPQQHHQNFQSMPRRNRVIVAHCAAILRIAYALDVERTQRIRHVRCEVSRGQLLMHLDRRQIALEQWSVAGKTELFGEVFGLKVALVPRSEE